MFVFHSVRPDNDVKSGRHVFDEFSSKLPAFVDEHSNLWTRSILYEQKIYNNNNTKRIIPETFVEIYLKKNQ